MTNDGANWRLFVAVPVPPALSKALVELQAEIRQALPEAPIRWTRREKLHLTLSFLGWVEAGRVAALIDVLQAVASTTKPMTLIAERIGVFPPGRSPRTIWVSVRDEANELSSLAARLSRDFAPFADHEPESDYIGHITIGRPRRLAKHEKKRLLNLMQNLSARRYGEWVAQDVVLMRSVSDDSGSSYTELARCSCEAE